MAFHYEVTSQVIDKTRSLTAVESSETIEKCP